MFAGGNCAFVFIKPHAVTEPVKQLVSDTLSSQNFRIVTQGAIGAEEIDQRMLIDQHYYAIAAKATLKKPNELPVPEDKFKSQFGIEWKDALAQNKVFNAKDACDHLGVTSSQLNDLWAESKKKGNLVKFGGGFYCGLIEKSFKKIYVFNGFFMSMRGKYVNPGASIYYYVIQWEKEMASWEDFRGKVLGPTDPADAPAGSLRGLIASKWKELGLAAPCDTGDNGVHASASPFEALSERMNWLGWTAEQDVFGMELLRCGVPLNVIQDWSLDPQVAYGEKMVSLFDSLEDTNTDECLMRCRQIAGLPEPIRTIYAPLQTTGLTLEQIFPYGAPEGFSLEGYSNVVASPPADQPIATPSPPADSTTANSRRPTPAPLDTVQSLTTSFGNTDKTKKKKSEKKVKTSKKKKSNCC